MRNLFAATIIVMMMGTPWCCRRKNDVVTHIGEIAGVDHLILKGVKGFHDCLLVDIPADEELARPALQAWPRRPGGRRMVCFGNLGNDGTCMRLWQPSDDSAQCGFRFAQDAVCVGPE